MRQKGSILVVVLGLLAILAVIGVAFLTMSSLERSTATSFALQTQMMLAADGALDYAVHQMVTDVWEYSTDDKKLTFRDPPGLLTGINKCEPFDCPGPDDAWLSGNITGNSTPNPISFAGAVVKRFGINFGGPTAVVDNLGLPGASPAPNGIWIPDLAAPCDQYLVRASVTILDHGGLLNANAHGSRNTWKPGPPPEGWEYGDCRNRGYFVNDVQPQVNLTSLLYGIGTPGTVDWVPGCWGADNKPGNSEAGAVLIENPGLWGTGADVPYTLDEEFELRNLAGTLFNSRLEQIGAISASAYAKRLKYTTVSWTAEVRGDGNATDHVKVAGGDWSAVKVDLNTASPDAIYEALRDGRAWADGDELKQLVANIIAFRSRSNDFDADFSGKVGAERQPFFSEVTAEGSENSDKTAYDWTIKVELFNPWPGDAYGNTDGLTVTGMTVAFGTTTVSTLAGKIGDKKCHPTTFTHTVNVPNTPGAKLTDELSSITLKKGSIALDEITTADIARLDVASKTQRLYRPINWEDEPRGSVTNAILKVYIGDWLKGGTAAQSNFDEVNRAMPANPIPIRFPNCVSDGATGLPPRPTAGGDFKAFARVGDLNQVLRGTGAAFWPWVVTVSKTKRTTNPPSNNESTVKFDWMKDIGNLDFAAGTAAAYAANVLSVGGPWNDGLDNDGDGKTDFDDTGKPDAGQPGGPEFRVAGKINLNTAAPDTLQQLASGVGTSGLSGIAASRPLKSPAEVIASAATPTGIEARDEPFTRISNIATVRSDVFSVYGTVQIVDPTTAVNGIIPDSGIVRSRRFWALVDRSPSLAYPPTDKTNFIYPRILNFQWLD